MTATTTRPRPAAGVPRRGTTGPDDLVPGQGPFRLVVVERAQLPTAN